MTRNTCDKATLHFYGRFLLAPWRSCALRKVKDDTMNTYIVLLLFKPVSTI